MATDVTPVLGEQDDNETTHVPVIFDEQHNNSIFDTEPTETTQRTSVVGEQPQGAGTNVYENDLASEIKIPSAYTILLE